MEEGYHQHTFGGPEPIYTKEISDKRRFRQPKLLLGLVVLAGVLVFAAVGTINFVSLGSSSTSDVSSISIQDSLIRVTNRYTERDGPAGTDYPYLEGLVVLEPYQQTHFEVANPEEGSSYKWVVTDTKDQVYEQHLADSFVTHFTQLYGEYAITLFKKAPESEEYRFVTRHSAVVKYVRRELRQLHDEDREAILEAMRTMYDVGQTEGVEKYGPAYLSMLELHKIHLVLAGQIDCDHMHPGYGFANHHIALSNLFEKSMQAVNPKLALPYWNYIRDIEEWEREWYKQKAAGLDTPDWNNWGPMNDWFGGTTDEGFIANGPFAYLKVPTLSEIDDSEKIDMPHNGYGQLRAPWNNNPNEYLVRHSSKCGLGPENWFNEIDGRCKSLIQDLKHVDNLLDWISDVSASPHVLVHILLGGSLGCEDALDTLVPIFGDETVDTLRQVWYDMSKALVREGVLACDHAGDCYCPDFDTYMADDQAIDDMVPNGIMCCHGVDTSDWSDLPRDHKRIVMNAVCNSGLYNGDALEASSSGAPEFWFLHQNIDRLYQYHYLKYPFSDESFGLGGYWQGSGTGGTCWGHNADDFVLGGYGGVWQYGKKKQMWHQEYAALLSPETDNGFGYIYADFDYSFCEEFGPGI